MDSQNNEKNEKEIKENISSKETTPDTAESEKSSETGADKAQSAEKYESAADTKVEKIKKKKMTKSRRRAIVLEIQIVALFLAVCFVLGAIVPLRPTVSEEEKRELTKFPTPTIASVMNGSFFSELELWYADTYPLRQTWIDINSLFTSLFGKKEQQVIGSLPTSGDSIPTVASDHSWLDPDIPTADTTTANKPSTSAQTPAQTTDSIPQTQTATPVTTSKPVTTAPVTKAPETTANGETNYEKINSVYLFGDTAYELYGFSKKSSDRYVNLVNALADRMDGKATVYSVIAPLAYGIQLDETTQKKLGLTDENQALVYMYSNMNDKVKKVYAYNNLVKHKNEYLYFRTDHHWTALGAYYTYEMFCAHKGIAPIPLSSYTVKEFNGFLGTMYSTCNNPAAMKSNPDTVYAYVPNGTNTLTFWTSKGEGPVKWNVVRDVSGWNAASKYNTFIGGDNPYSEIHNSSKSDGSACVVVKNSFGNAFVPFLVDHYEYVYVVDLRYYDTWSTKYNNGLSFAELVEQKGISDILIVTNIIATGSSGMLTCMEKLFTK